VLQPQNEPPARILSRCSPNIGHWLPWIAALKAKRRQNIYKASGWPNGCVPFNRRTSVSLFLDFSLRRAHAAWMNVAAPRRLYLRVIGFLRRHRIGGTLEGCRRGSMSAIGGKADIARRQSLLQAC
jgi:hypothetical protein